MLAALLDLLFSNFLRYYYTRNTVKFCFKIVMFFFFGGGDKPFCVTYLDNDSRVQIALTPRRGVFIQARAFATKGTRPPIAVSR